MPVLVEVNGRNPLGGIPSSAESVALGHPDKLCDYATDYALDGLIRASLQAQALPRYAVELDVKAGIPRDGSNLDLLSASAREVVLQHGLVVAAGEITVPERVSFNLRDSLKTGLRLAGYDDPKGSFYPTDGNILLAVNQQSLDIAAGVDTGGAGDQGLMVGFATDQTLVNMPLPIMIARALTDRQTELFETHAHNGSIKPDGKSQVILRQHVSGEQLVTDGISNLTIAVAHDPLLPLSDLRRFLLREQIQPVLDSFDLEIDANTQLVINGAGDWTVYGPPADNGQVGRKLMAGGFGLAARHGGGAPSSKDPTKVDRSGAYFARYIAKCLVEAKIAGSCEVVVGYSIGVPTPHLIQVNTYGTLNNGWDDKRLAQLIQDNFSWTVQEMIKELDLWQPIYARTVRIGAFGNTEFPWEKPRELK